MHDGTLYIILACLIGLVMTWGIGANDLANIMSTTMGSKALTVRQALIIAAVFEFAGAFFGGGHVSNTIRSGIIDTQHLLHQPNLLVYGMLAVLSAGTVWMLLASFIGMPVSITNAIVGALVGFGAVVFGLHAIHWHKVWQIAISWIASPTIAGVVAYTLFKSVQRLIFSTDQPDYYVRQYLPIYLFITGLILANMVVIKGLQHFHYQLSSLANLTLAIVCGIIVCLVGMFFSKRIPHDCIEDDTRSTFDYVERHFSILMAFTACAMVFAHGSNDVAIAVGPIAAIFSTAQGHLGQANPLPSWVVFFATGGVFLGLIMYGRKVIATVGTGITALTPSRAFAATLAAATTVVVSTGTGIPVSATQTLVGAVLGVGLARGIGALNLTIIRNIFMSWIVTLPVASILAIGFYYLFHNIFG